MDTVDKTVESDESRREKTIKLSRDIEREHKQQQDGLQAAVERYIRENPKKYASAQLEGEHIMNSNYELKEGDDSEGDFILAQKIYNDLQYYGLPLESLEPEELELVTKYKLI